MNEPTITNLLNAAEKLRAELDTDVNVTASVWAFRDFKGDSKEVKFLVYTVSSRTHFTGATLEDAIFAARKPISSESMIERAEKLEIEASLLRNKATQMKQLEVSNATPAKVE